MSPQSTLFVLHDAVKSHVRPSTQRYIIGIIARHRWTCGYKAQGFCGLYYCFSLMSNELPSVSWPFLLRVQAEEKAKREKFVLSVAYSPDGKKIACGCQDGTLCLFDCQTGKLLHSLEGHYRPVRSVTFTPGESPRNCRDSTEIVQVGEWAAASEAPMWYSWLNWRAQWILYPKDTGHMKTWNFRHIIQDRTGFLIRYHA